MTGTLALLVGAPIVLPPDGATDVPTNAEILVTGAAAGLDVEVALAGEPVSGAQLSSETAVRFSPREDFPADAVVDVWLYDGGTVVQELAFRTGSGPLAAPVGTPDMGPELVATLEQAGPEDSPSLWTFEAEGQKPDASPWGSFEVIYARTELDDASAVDAVWAAEEGPARGSWTDSASHWYCAAVGYVDVAGQHTDSVEVCTDLEDPSGRSCSYAPGAPIGGWLLLVAAGLRRKPSAEPAPPPPATSRCRGGHGRQSP